MYFCNGFQQREKGREGWWDRGCREGRKKEKEKRKRRRKKKREKKQV